MSIEDIKDQVELARWANLEDRLPGHLRMYSVGRGLISTIRLTVDWG